MNITEALCFRSESILAGYLNAKHSVWNSKVPNPSGLKLLDLVFCSEFKISDPQCSVYYTSDGRGDVLDVAGHQNI
jgi:hypothetical protein